MNMYSDVSKDHVVASYGFYELYVMLWMNGFIFTVCHS